jgi:chromosomal replication initiation ATPase DnaA
MPDNPEQLIFDLELQPRYGAEDFLVGPSNRFAWEMVTAWPAWQDPILILVGPGGSGKSHLAAIWREQASAVMVQRQEMSESNLGELLRHRAVVIRDADRGCWDEAAFFHFLNRAREGSVHVLITARTPPDQWNIKTKDLLSRLRLAPVIGIAVPDDELLRAVLVKLFLDQQLVVDTGVVEYVAVRIERSFAHAREIVHALNCEALKRGSRITRAMAADLLKFPEEREGSGKTPVIDVH